VCNDLLFFVVYDGPDRDELPDDVVNLLDFFDGIRVDKDEFHYTYNNSVADDPLTPEEIEKRKNAFQAWKWKADQEKNTVEKVLHMLMWIAIVYNNPAQNVVSRWGRKMGFFTAEEEEGEKGDEHNSTSTASTSTTKSRQQLDFQAPKWICRMERDSFFFPENFRKMVKDLDARESHFLGARQFYEAGRGDRVWNDGGPGICFSMNALTQLGLFLADQKRRIPIGEYDANISPGVQCQLYYKGHREDMMVAGCLGAVGIYPSDKTVDKLGREKFVIMPRELYRDYDMPRNPALAWKNQHGRSWNYWRGRAAMNIHPKCWEFLEGESVGNQHCENSPDGSNKCVASTKKLQTTFSDYPVSFNSFKEVDKFESTQKERELITEVLRNEVAYENSRNNSRNGEV